jgi:DnaK suppressor protein
MKKSRFSPKQLERYKKRLAALKQDLLFQINGLGADSKSEMENGGSAGTPGYGMHLADAASNSYERDIAMGLASSEREILMEIDEAIARVNDGTFGYCLGSGEPIPKERLDAIPYARYTREYQEKSETR